MIRANEIDKRQVCSLGNSIVIGLDIGTTSVKAVAFHLRGFVIREYEVEYLTKTPHPGWAEQDPLEIEEATIQALRHLIGGFDQQHTTILAIGLSSAMHSLICMDKEGEPLSPSLIWADGRGSRQASLLKEQGISVYQATGTPIHPMSPLIKLIWMKETNYEPYQKATRFVSIKEFILFRWFRTELVDYAVAAATGLFNIHTLKWDEHALKLAGITKDQLFDPVPPITSITGLNHHIAEKIGISIHTPFIIGASDGPLANLGIGAIRPGEVAITIGTSGAIRQIVSEPKIDHFQETFCYTFTDSLSLIGGPVNNGGIVLKWLKEIVGQNLDYDALTELAKMAPPGAEGLLFSPYLNGERAPMWNANIRGNLLGLSVRHKQEHLIRAGLEGVIYSIFHVGEALERLAGQPKKILASGGFARSSLWLQILADVFNQEVEVPISHQSSAWGAAWMALLAIGEVNDLASIKEHIPMKGNYIPNNENHQIYQEKFMLYKELSILLNKHFLS